MEGRFDASFHNLTAKAALAVLRKGKYPLRRLGHLASRINIPPRFKRIYVDPEHGIPFLQGSHVPMVRPFDLKFLSRTAHRGLGPWVIEKGWVLVTCSGTIGRTCLVSSYLHKWAASQHISRVLATLPRLHPGYIAAFLMSPFGQEQLRSKIYGGVVDELTERDIGAIWVPEAPPDLQSRIGELVVTAFEKKDEAFVKEEEVINRLEELIATSSATAKLSVGDSRRGSS